MEKIEKQNYVLSNGTSLPVIGMGTYPLKGQSLKSAMFTAIDCGFRLFDTAHNYNNEESLGIAAKQVFSKKGLSRQDIFITTKVGEELFHGIGDGKLFYKKQGEPEKDIFSIVDDQIKKSLQLLQTDYLDVVLIHFPYPDYLEKIWNSLERLYHDGIIRAIGTANCRERHLKRIMASCTIRPMINQVEITPLNTQESLVDFCQKEHIQVQVFSPLMCMRMSQIKDSRLINQICSKYHCSTAQLILRWNIQRKLLPIPKASSFRHLSENISLLFQIDDADMKTISSLNEDYQYLPESLECPGY
jgi:diketogulonate reductase-like aldo/keto reductase